MSKSPLPPSFLDTYSLCHLLDGRPALLAFLSFLLYPLQEWFRVFYKEESPGVYPFNETPAIDLGFEKFSRLPEVLFFHFFHLHLFDGIRFNIPDNL